MIRLFSFNLILLAILSVSCKKTGKEVKPVDTALSGGFTYLGMEHNLPVARCKLQTYVVENPKFGQPGEPAQFIHWEGLEINLKSSLNATGIWLQLVATGRSVGKYAGDIGKPQGFRMFIYENGTQFKRAVDGNGDSAWLELTMVNFKDSLISGKFYTKEKSLISGGDTSKAITSGEFRNVKIQP